MLTDYRDRLRAGTLRPVFHGNPDVLTLGQLVRNYNNLVEDATRVMLRIKALFRASAIPAKGVTVYRPAGRDAWLERLDGGARIRAASLLRQLDVLLELRVSAKAAMVVEARRQRGWRILRSIPYLGPVRVAQIMAIIRTPFRFRTKRNLWPYAGLAVVTRSSADQEFVDGRLRKRKRPTAHSGPEPQSQPGTQGGVQGSCKRSHYQARALARFLRGIARSRRSRGAGKGNAGAEDRLNHAAPVEERRALGSNQADDASDIAPPSIGDRRQRVTRSDDLGRFGTKVRG
jgi:hypothetical protein